MRTVLLVCVIALWIGVGLYLMATTPGDSVASFDPQRPVTLLPIVASHLRGIHSSLSDLRVGDLIEAATAGFRERVRHEDAAPLHPR